MVDYEANGWIHVQTKSGLSLQAGAGQLNRASGQTVWVTTKAEKIRVHPDGAAGEDANLIPGTVTEVEYIGPKLDLSVELEDGQVLLTSNEPTAELRRLQRGDRVTVRIPPEALYVI